MVNASTLTIRKRTAALIVSLVAMIPLVTIASQVPAHALGPGRVCVFDAPLVYAPGGIEVGHVGWAFWEPGANRYFFGSTENPTGVIAHSSFNGAWVRTASSFDAMMSVMGNEVWEPVPASQQSFVKDNIAASQQAQKIRYRNGAMEVRVHAKGYYWYVRCVNTATSAVGGAVDTANAAKNVGYNLYGNNCVDAVYRILNTYRGGSVPVPGSSIWTITPNDYFWTGLDNYGFESFQILP